MAVGVETDVLLLPLTVCDCSGFGTPPSATSPSGGRYAQYYVFWKHHSQGAVQATSALTTANNLVANVLLLCCLAVIDTGCDPLDKESAAQIKRRARQGSRPRRKSLGLKPMLEIEVRAHCQKKACLAVLWICRPNQTPSKAKKPSEP